MEKETGSSKENLFNNPLSSATETGRGRRRGLKRLAWKIAGYSSIAAIGFIALASI